MDDTNTTNAVNAAAEAPATDPNALSAMVKELFHFKTEKLKNETGEVIGEGKKHPSVTLDLPVPTIKRLQQFLADPATYAKEVELLISTVTDTIYSAARAQINDWREANKDGTVTAAAINYDKLDWTAIANMPKRERASSVPDEDDIKAFLEVYLEVMPAALNRPKKNIENHILCFQTVFRRQRSAKDILEMFQNSLAVFIQTVGEEVVAQHLQVLEYYSDRLAKLLASEEKISMDTL
jgi:hypothetical protein